MLRIITKVTELLLKLLLYDGQVTGGLYCNFADDLFSCGHLKDEECNRRENKYIITMTTTKDYW